MSDLNFKGILVEDSRLQLTDELKFAVICGAAQSTYSPISALSISNSAINFNVNCPSESIVLDRHILIQSQVTFQLNITGVPQNQPALKWGWDCGWGTFPIQSMMTSCSATINNCTVQTNVQDVLSMLIRLNDDRCISSTNSTTAAMPDDAYCNYRDGVGSNNNPLGSFNTSGFDSDFTGRGSILTDITVEQSLANGDFVNNSIIGNGAASATNTFKIVISALLTEPFVCLSPFLAMKPTYDPGLMGINNITLNIQLDGVGKRIFRNANCDIDAGGVNEAGYVPNYPTTMKLGNDALHGAGGGVILPASSTCLSSTRLLFNYLSLQPDQASRLKSARNIVSYLEYPRFISNPQNNNPIGPAGFATLQSSSLQLNMVNDLIIIGVRLPMSNQNMYCSDSWLGITGITISYNNQSGILASASAEQLFNLSKRNGSGQNWNEFNSMATNGLVNGAAGASINIGTTGSLLVLNPALDFNLDPSLASSSLGQFNLQVGIECYNQYGFIVRPEIVIITLNSGVFSTLNGSSEVCKGLLTRDIVNKVKSQSPAAALTTSEMARLVGGKLHHGGVYNSHFVNHHHKHHKGHSNSEPASGGIHSGGSIASAGKLKKHIR